MALAALIFTMALTAACQPGAASDEAPLNGALVAQAESSFDANLPPGFTLCRSEVGVDHVSFEVRRGAVVYLTVGFSAHPFGNDGPDGDHIAPGETGGHVRRSPDGRLETLMVTLDGGEHLRLSMTRTSQTYQGGVWYLIVDVSRDLSADQAAVAEAIGSSIHAR